MDRRSATLISIISVLILILVFSTSTTAQQAAQKFIGIELVPQAVSPITSGKIGIYGKTDGEGYLQKANGSSCQLCSGGGGGDITAVTAGSGLAGGGTTGDVILSMPSVGTAATYNLGAGSITTDGQGRVSGATSGVSPPTSRTITAGTGLTGGGDLSANRTISMPSVGTPSSCTNCSITTDTQGRVTVLASGAGSTPSLQQVYTASTAPVDVQESTANGTIGLIVPNNDAGVPALRISRGNCDIVGQNYNGDAGTRTECAGLNLENPMTATSGHAQMSPELCFTGQVQDLTKVGPAQFRKDITCMSNQPPDTSNDTSNLNFFHSRDDGATWSMAFGIRQQEDFVGGETILYNMPTDRNGGASSLCQYPGDGNNTHSTAFQCLTGKVWQFGPFLGSTSGIRGGIGGGGPNIDGIFGWGSTTSRFREFTVGAWDINGSGIYGFHADGTGSGFNQGPYVTDGLWLDNDDVAAGSGQKIRSPAIVLRGSGWNNTASAGGISHAMIMGSTIERPAGRALADIEFWTQTDFLTTTVVSAVLEGTEANENFNGVFRTRHYSGIGGTSTAVVAGAATNCTTAATIALSAESGDHAGTVIVTTGAAACAAGSMFTVTFSIAYQKAGVGTSPHVVWSPSNANAAAKDFYIDQVATTSTTFEMKTVSALAAATEYKITYMVMQ